MIDSHCHIQFNAYKNDAEEVIKRCRQRGVFLNCVGSQMDTSRRAVEYADKYPDVYATVGLHPVHLFATEVDEEENKFVSREESFDYEEYKKLAGHPKVVAIGECGLELFHIPPNITKEEMLVKQKEAFLAQYKLARELNLPVVIHVREAHEEMIELLRVIARSPDLDRTVPAKAGEQSRAQSVIPAKAGIRDFATADSRFRGNDINGVVHCFTADWPTAQKYLELGLYLGFTGVITFPAKKTNPQPTLDLMETIKNCPLDRILIETDAPYLAPQAYRGQRCEPWMVAEVAKKIAEIKGLTLEEIIKITENNTRRLFDKIKD